MQKLKCVNLDHSICTISLLVAFRCNIDFLNGYNLACLTLVKRCDFKADSLSQFGLVHCPSMPQQATGMPHGLNGTICTYQSGHVGHLSLYRSQDSILAKMPLVDMLQVQ